MERQSSADERSLFPQGITLDEARKAIAGCFEFKEKEENGLIFIDYRFSSKKTFPDPNSATDPVQRRLLAIRRECRGLVISAATGKVVARRYHKFFNIGELEETHESLIDLTKPHVILTKYDGSLVSAVRIENQIRFATKGGLSEVSKILESRFLSETKVRYAEFAEHWLSKDCTAIFEWCSSRTRIVLDYPVDMLVLTAIRHNDTGHYVLYDEMKKSASQFDIPVTEAWPGSPKGLAEFQRISKEEKNIEGFVIRFDDGRMYKVKTEWYFSRSKKDKQDFSFNSEANIWKYVLEEQLDDALAFMNDQRLRERARDFGSLLWERVGQLQKKLEDLLKTYVASLPSNTKPEFVKLVKEKEKNGQLTALESSVLFLAYDGKDLAEHLVANLKKNCTSKGLETIRPLLGGLKFTE